MNEVYSFLKYCCSKVEETERLIRYIKLLLKRISAKYLFHSKFKSFQLNKKLAFNRPSMVFIFTDRIAEISMQNKV